MAEQLPGSIGWFDLTVPDAVAVRDFYCKVVGWTHSGVEMGGYQDFCMNMPETGTTVAGICHARGVNTGIPPVWLMYIVVVDIDAALAACVENGGKVLQPKRSVGESFMAVIQDPAGAITALYQAEAGK